MGVANFDGTLIQSGNHSGSKIHGHMAHFFIDIHRHSQKCGLCHACYIAYRFRTGKENKKP